MLEEQIKNQAEMLSNRVRKRFAHLYKKFARRNIDCFRLYDWDIPEIRAVVDWYAGHLVIAEYQRTQTGPEWLPYMANAVASALGVCSDNVHIKRRRTMTETGVRYKKEKKSGGVRFIVKEGALKFWVNLDDFLDTGLYSDHRDTRLLIKDISKDKDFLNLYSYTGSFTCYAVSGGARSTVSVDRSATHLSWAKENLKLNGFDIARNVMVQSDVFTYLDKIYKQGIRFTLAFVDPPSFYQDRNKGRSFDINRDHPVLLEKVLKVMSPGSEVFFSANHQRFEPKLSCVKAMNLKEITTATIPEDYRNLFVHRCWRMTAI